MQNLMVNSVCFVVALATIATAQTRSAAANVQLRALVAPIAKIAVNGEPKSSPGSEGVAVRTTGEGNVEILASIASRPNSTLITIPVRIITNTRSYLLRVSSIAEGTSGTIRARTLSSRDTREFPLAANRSFGLGSPTASSSSDESYIDVVLPPTSNEQQIRIEIQAVPMN